MAVPDKHNPTFAIKYLPMEMYDKPYFRYRGVMIDSGRHFIPKKDILRTIDAMMYNKLNALHIHISDGDSFPMQLREFPEITAAGAFS